MLKFDDLSFKSKINLFAMATFLTLGGYAAYGLTRSTDADPCSLRYSAGTQISLTKPNGAPLMPAELQARVGIGERDMAEKASVVRLDKGPVPIALDVKVGGPVETDTGISFLWSPTGVVTAPSACLSYRLLLPSNFDFGRGGELPGLIGGVTGRTAGRDIESGFSSRFSWDERGGVGLNLATPSDKPDQSPINTFTVRSERGQLVPGRWIDIEQELVLNEPSAKNGLVRLWVDGRLVVTDKAVAWRGKGAPGLSGVTAGIGYRAGDPRYTTPAAKVTSVRLSPMRLSWQLVP
jgi:hypothetical protein